MSTLIFVFVALLVPARRLDAGVDVVSSARPTMTSFGSTSGHRTGDGAIVRFNGGTIEMGFKPVAGRTRAVLRFRCAPGRCRRNFRDPLLLIPILNAPHLRVKFRSAEGELVSATPLSRLPHGSMLSFSLSDRRYTLQMR